MSGKSNFHVGTAKKEVLVAGILRTRMKYKILNILTVVVP